MDKTHDLLRISYPLFLYHLSESVTYLKRSVNANVAHDKRFLQLFKQIFIYFGK